MPISDLCEHHTIDAVAIAAEAMKYQHPELEIVRAALNQASGPVMQTGA